MADIQADYPSASLNGNTLTVPFEFALTVREGGQGVMGKVIHRECQQVMVTVWATDHATRSALAKPIDVAIKSNIVVTMPDTSQAKVVYQRTNMVDDHQNVAFYRRDLVYEVEYATVETFPGWTITSADISVIKQEYDAHTAMPTQAQAII